MAKDYSHKMFWQSILCQEKSYKILAQAAEEFRTHHNSLLAVAQTFEQKVKISKAETQKFSLIKAQNGTVFALYPGKTMLFGKGNNGRLKLAKNVNSGALCLVKINQLDNSLCDSLNVTLPILADNECDFLEKRALLHSWQHRLNSKNISKDYKFIKILPGITLGRLVEITLEKKVTLTSVQQATLIRNILQAIKQMHQSGIWHQDLHKDNILVNPIDWQVNILDFGYSSFWRSEEKKSALANDIFVLFKYINEYIAKKWLITEPKICKMIESMCLYHAHPYDFEVYIVRKFDIDDAISALQKWLEIKNQQRQVGFSHSEAVPSYLQSKMKEKNHMTIWRPLLNQFQVKQPGSSFLALRHQSPSAQSVKAVHGLRLRRLP